MIIGGHIIIYSKDANADRAFFREVLGFAGVDAGKGWLIFRLAPAELAIHPAQDNGRHELYLMCDDVDATARDLQSKGIVCQPITDQGWGLLTSFTLPGGGAVGLYQPRHPTALELR
jgi:catechol 2,3-dioxygenase-like lactoylglutathione lyase family enzyme